MIHLCEHKRPPGWGIDGAFARYVAAPAYLAHVMPDDLPLTTAALCEPLAIVLTGLARLRNTPGEHRGHRPVSLGLLAAIAARASGMARVAVVGRGSSAARLALASRLGFETINSDQVQPATLARPGLDSVVDTTASASGIDYGLNMVKRAGQLVSLGLSDGADVPVPWNLAMQRNVTLHFSLSSEYASWDHALSLLGAVQADLAQLITCFPLGEWQDAFHAVQQRRVVKALLIPE